MADSYAFLKKVGLFADLPEADLEHLCEHVEDLHIASGDILFAEGSLGQSAYIIVEGQIEIYKTVEGKRVQLAQRGPGEVIGEMALLEQTPRNASGEALADTSLIVISYTLLDDLLNNNPSASRKMLSTISSRLRNTEMLLRQSEKMAQLGTLMAGIAHELNNPSAAVARSSKQLAAAMADLQSQASALSATGIPASRLNELGQSVIQRSSQRPQMNMMERSDRETAFEDWLEEQDVADGWKLASLLVDLGETPQSLARLAAEIPAGSLAALLRWMTASFSVYSLLEEVGQGAGRISEIVKALKSYVYLDQAPIQEIDLHEGLENTLVILRHKLKGGIEVVCDYAPNLPPILAYGSELNQVWTNLIDNAIDAMGEKGRLVVQTVYQSPWVTVSIEDNGPGIPPEAQEKMFNPFFTTKPLGKGTGLGLSITYNIVHKHRGEIKVTSRPGKTRFDVRLPLNFETLPKNA